MYFASTSVNILFHWQDFHTGDCESKTFELSPSFEESERKQNALGKSDASLVGE